jgi:hypothetical protein
LVSAFFVASCSATGVGVTTTTLPATTSTTQATTSTVPATTTTTTLALPAVDLHDDLVWYGPNMGSVDFPELFSQPELWSTARDRVDVFKFASNALAGFPYDIGGDNVLDTFVEVGAFAKLHEWGIAISVEAGAIKFFACEAQSWADYANLAIDNVEANGGQVSFLSMDEPLIGGQVVENGQTCGLTMDETAAVVAEFVSLVTTAHPDVIVGDIEAYPHYPVADLEQWILALQDAGVTPAFLHLDVDIERAEVESQNVIDDLRRLRDFSEQQGIPFGVILTANWTFTDSDERYFQSTTEWADTVTTALGRTSHVIFQSWWGPAPSGLHEVPINLPEDDPAVPSHTRLINEILDALG